MRTPTRASAGLSTLEMLLACAIIGLLLAISMPSFSDQTARARRADGLAAILAIQQAQERYRSSHARYAASVTVLGLSETSDGRHYRLSTATEVDSAGTAHRITATGQNAQAADRPCQSLGLATANGQATELSGPTTAFGNDAAANKTCWRH